MKNFKTLLIFVCLFIATNSRSQIILNETFATGGAGWITSNGSSVGQFEDPNNACVLNAAIRTPGVGGNNPAKVLSPVITPTLKDLTVQFSVWRFDANLTCASRSNFGCNTYVDILMVESSYNGTDPVADGAVIYANYSNYLLPIAGGTVTLNVTLPLTLPQFRIFFNFTAPGNCNQPGTKYVLDNFVVTQFDQPCIITGTCPPVATDDYFKAETQGFMSSALLANLYGTNIGYTPPPAHISNVTRSLNNGVYAPTGGVDYDFDNHPLNAMTFTLLTTDFTNAEATLTFYSDGTFDFTKLDQVRLLYSFTYRLTDPNGNFDDAVVTIDYRLSSTLPVNLLYFTAMKQNKKVVLDWATSIENDNVGFTVERQLNGAFVPVHFIATKALNGNSSSALYYTYTDNDPTLKGLVKYRVKQTDKNGAVKYTEIRSVTFNNKFEITTYPNPSAGLVNIVIPDDAGAVDISILDLNGKTVQQMKNTLARKVTFNHLEAGMYLIKVKVVLTNESFSQKLLVK